MIFPERISDVSGLVVFGILFVIQLMTKNKGNKPTTPKTPKVETAN